MGPQARRVEAVVVRGATTPWSWASLPGLLHRHRYSFSGGVYVQGASGAWGVIPPGWKLGDPGVVPNSPVWLTSERRPEGAGR